VLAWIRSRAECRNFDFLQGNLLGQTR